MALQSIANYRVGKSYKFDIKDFGTKLAEVKEKGYKKLLLEYDGGKFWYTIDELSLPVKIKTTEVIKPVVKEVKTVDVKKFIGNVAKVVTGNLKEKPLSKPVEYDPDKDALNYQKADTLQPKELEADWEYIFGRFTRIIREGLVKKGYPEVMKMKQAELREWLINKIPNKK